MRLNLPPLAGHLETEMQLLKTTSIGLLLSLQIVISQLAMAWTPEDHYQRKRLVERVYIQGDSLKNNIIGEFHGHEVIVYLPSSYYQQLNKHYPVVYMLHGFGGTADAWFSNKGSNPNSQAAMDALITSGSVQEMILVVPDTNTRHIGSWYQNSVISGSWEDYIVTDVISAIDTKFRTIEDSASRGLLGHSMGGLGALTIASRHPELFSSVALMSPAPFNMAKAPWQNWQGFYPFVKPQLDLYTGVMSELDFIAHTFVSMPQVSIADPSNPPTYIADNPDQEHFERMVDFNLASLAGDLSPAAAELNWYTELGNQDTDLNPNSIRDFNALIQIFQNQGVNIHSQVFTGGHTDQFNMRMPVLLQYMSDHLASGE